MTDCPNCGDPIADPLSVIETSTGRCPHCGTYRDELFDIALETAPDRSAEEIIAENHAPEVDE